MSGFRELENGLLNNEVVEKYGVPKNTISTWIKNKLKYFTALEQPSNERKNEIQWLRTNWPRILELLQRFESLHVHDAARKQSSNYLTENKITIPVKISICFLSPIARLTKVNTEVNTVLGLFNAL